MKNLEQYDNDLFAWAMQQAQLLRAGNYACVDAENVAEELEAMARRERRELFSRLHILLLHLLKWQTRPQDRRRMGAGWKITIREQREQIADILEDSPSLHSYFDELAAKAWKRAVEHARDEVPGHPFYQFDTSPWRFEEEVLKEGFLPD
jgi:hypothetical protein